MAKKKKEYKGREEQETEDVRHFRVGVVVETRGLLLLFEI
jgi:hypothetical protein